MLNDKPVIAVLPAVDIKRAKKFYEEKLELKATTIEEMPGYLFVEGDGGVELVIYERTMTKADHTVATFLVEDIEDEVKNLTKKGVVFEQYEEENIQTDVNGISTHFGSKAAWFKDSEGNILSLTEFTDIETDLDAD